MGLIAALFAVPLVEIVLFVTVGSWLGVGPTLLIVLGTGVAGVAILRHQGTQAMRGLRSATQQLRDPIGPMADSAVVAFGAVLLILPGFLTDTLGLLLMIPPLRRMLIAALARRVVVQGMPFGTPSRRSGSDVIDGEFFEVTPDLPEIEPRTRPPSGWTQH